MIFSGEAILYFIPRHLIVLPIAEESINTSRSIEKNGAAIMSAAMAAPRCERSSFNNVFAAICLSIERISWPM